MKPFDRKSITFTGAGILLMLWGTQAVLTGGDPVASEPSESPTLSREPASTKAKEAMETSMDRIKDFPKEFRELFTLCDGTRETLQEVIKETREWSLDWWQQQNLSVTEVRKHLYQPSWQGQLLSTLLINQMDKKVPFRGLGQTCQARFTGWRKALEERKNPQQVKQRFEMWAHCLSNEVYDGAEVTLVKLFRQCGTYEKSNR